MRRIGMKRMRKTAAVLLVALLMAVPAFAGDHFHMSFSLGSPAMFGAYDRPFLEPAPGVGMSYGFNLGLSSRVELNLGAVSSIVPDPFSENTFFTEVQVALLGKTSTASKVSGSNVNMYLGLGGFYSWDDMGYQSAGPYISWTPISMGTPISGRRERMMKTSFGWDCINNKAVLAFSLVNFDFFVRGTYRDWY